MLRIRWQSPTVYPQKMSWKKLYLLDGQARVVGELVGVTVIEQVIEEDDAELNGRDLDGVCGVCVWCVWWGSEDGEGSVDGGQGVSVDGEGSVVHARDSSVCSVRVGDRGQRGDT